MQEIQEKLFSFNLGTNSIGWAVFSLNKKGEPNKIIDIGSGIFSDGRNPNSKASLAVERREARNASKNIDRTKRRRKAILRTLIEYELMPANKEAQKALLAETSTKSAQSNQEDANPYALRRRALDKQLPPAYIGRALFHLSQRRGFQSNRKTDLKESDKGKIARGIDDLREAMKQDGARTYGEWLAMRQAKGLTVRLRKESDVVNKDGYSYFPERSMLKEELEAIWKAQAQYYPEILTQERLEHLSRVIFFQRPLKTPKVGKCSYNPLEERLPKAHPLFQEVRLYKEINELELVMTDQRHVKLTMEQRDAVVDHLMTRNKASFGALRKVLGLERTIKFNKESDIRKDMIGHEVNARLSAENRFGDEWLSFDIEKQWEIVEKLRNEQDSKVLFSWVRTELDIDGERAEAIVNCPIPEGHGRLGITAISSILDELKNTLVDGFVIHERMAAENCGYNPSNLGYDGEGEDYLPPYQEILDRHIPPGTGDLKDLDSADHEVVLDHFKHDECSAIPFGYDVYKGRITNPTVHIGLNQMRRLVNALIKRHGKPRFMALELARDLQISEQQKFKILQEIKRNTRRAEARSEEILKLRASIPRLSDNGRNRLMLKLWEELNFKDPDNRFCVFTGRRITKEMLFTSEIDVAHILPWSRTLDDSNANKIVCMKGPARQKGNRAPAEVGEWQGDYEAILERAKSLPKNKSWRFASDAMERFEGKDDFLARQLNDTQYLSRMAREYLECLYPSEEPDQYGVLGKRQHVFVTTGRLTEMLRRNWNLNSLLPDYNIGQTVQPKNRKDHRHHAIDAAVVGVTTRGLLQRISSAAKHHEGEFLQNIVTRMVADNPPWQGFRDDLKAMVSDIIVTHKTNHQSVSNRGKDVGKSKTAAKLHNDTAYGFGKDKNGNDVAVHRKSFMSLKPKDIPAIRDEHLQSELYDAIGNVTEPKALQEALLNFKERHKTFAGIRRVRIEEKLKLIPIRDKDGKVYKGVKGDSNQRYDVWETLDGKWHHEVVSTFDAHKKGNKSQFREDHPTARRVLRLQKNDMVAYEHPTDGVVIGRVVKFTHTGSIVFVEHKEGGNLVRRASDKNDPFSYLSKTATGLKKIQCRQVRVDPTGRVYDPGPQDRASKKARKERQKKST